MRRRFDSSMGHMLHFFEKNKFMAISLMIFIAGTIWYLSSISSDPVPSIGFKYKSYIYHFGIFFLLCLSAIISFSKDRKSENGKGIAIISSILYALIDELHQSFVPGRSVSVGDFLIDSLGIALAGIFYSFRIKNIHNKKLK